MLEISRKELDSVHTRQIVLKIASESKGSVYQFQRSRSLDSEFRYNFVKFNNFVNCVHLRARSLVMQIHQLSRNWNYFIS